jgi:hypothetical protein
MPPNKVSDVTRPWKRADLRCVKNKTRFKQTVEVMEFMNDARKGYVQLPTCMHARSRLRSLSRALGVQPRERLPCLASGPFSQDP